MQRKACGSVSPLGSCTSTQRIATRMPGWCQSAVPKAAGFAVYHRVLSHGHWCSRALAHRLLLLLVAAFVPDGPVVVGLDDTIERRWGARIAARGIYRDPVRSSRGHFVKASGLRWLCAMLLAPVPWAGCV
ncbi:MAG: transposase, partial [Acetobacteraceae bacterium]|nr:transposase [Acetobacteraceae bacterium]